MLSCTTVVGARVIVTGSGVTEIVDGSNVTVDGARVSVVRIMLLSTIVTAGGVTKIVLYRVIRQRFCTFTSGR